MGEDVKEGGGKGAWRERKKIRRVHHHRRRLKL